MLLFVELFVYHCQLVAAIGMTGLLPRPLKSDLYWAATTLLDVRSTMFDDFRVQFLLAGAVFPLMLGSLILFYVNRLQTTLWVGFLFFALTLLLAGTIQFLLPYSPYVGRQVSERFLLVGLVGLVLAIAFAAAWLFARSKTRRLLKRIMASMSELERVYYLWYRQSKEYLEPRKRTWYAFMVFAIALILASILAMTYVVNELSSSATVLSGPIHDVSIYMRTFFALIAGCLGVHMVMLSSLSGRNLSYRVVTAIKERFISGVFFFGHLAYLPVLNAAFSTFLCEDVLCPEGEVFPTRVFYAFSKSKGLTETDGVCVDCLFTEDCPEYLDICYAEQDSRLLV